MNARQLYKHLGTLISCGCADYQIVFMQAEKYPHAVGSVLPDHAGKTIDLWPYGDEGGVGEDGDVGADDGSHNPYGPVFGMDD